MRRTRKVTAPIGEDDTDYIGTMEGGQGFTFLPSDLSRSAHLTGVSGSGKTTVVLKIIELDILRESTVVVVIDLRGDLIAAVLALCTRLRIDPSQVTLLDLREKDNVVGFNPLAGAGKPYIKALHMLAVLEANAASWGVSLEEYCRNGLLVLASAGRALTDMEALFYDEAFLHTCLASVEDESLQAFWIRYSELSKDKRRGIASSVLNKLSCLTCVDVLRDVLGSRDPISLESILSNPGQILLVSCAVDELSRSGAMIGSLLVSAISREVLGRVNLPQAKRNPVRLVVDEFEYMAGEAFEELIQEGRRFNCTCCLSHQQYSQLPPKLKSLILANSGLRILFQLGYEDAKAVSGEVPERFGVKELRKLKPGEAVVLRRDGSARQLRFHPPAKSPPAKEVEAFRAKVLKGATPRATSPLQTEIGQPLSKPDLGEWI